MITAARLVDGAREMQLLNRADIAKVEFDIPLPEVRDDVSVSTDTDGTDDHTQRHGARAVSIALRSLDEGMDAVIAELGAFMHPALRPYLHVSNSDWIDGERRLLLRASAGGAPVAGPLYPFARDVQAQWTAPRGVWEAVNLTQFVVNADEEAAGRTYNLIEPRTYPASLSTGLVQHTNVGTTFAHLVARLYGPCRGPRLTNESTGQTISFSEDLELAAGEYVEVDTRKTSAYLMSDTDASRLDFMDLLDSQWWRLGPGLNEIRYHPRAGVDAGCRAYVDYLPAWYWL